MSAATHPHKSTKEGVTELYFHIREPHVSKKGKRFKAATMFARSEGEGNWFMSIARCSEGDNFCKASGRSIARRKLFNSANKADSDFAWLKDKPTYDYAVALYKSI